MMRDRSDTFELVLVLVRERVANLLRILSYDGQVINIDSYILVD